MPRDDVTDYVITLQDRFRAHQLVVSGGPQNANRIRLEERIEELREAWAAEPEAWELTDLLGCDLITLGSHLLKEDDRAQAIEIYDEAFDVIEDGIEEYRNVSPDEAALVEDRYLALLAVLHHNLSIVHWNGEDGGAAEGDEYDQVMGELGFDRLRNPFIWSVEWIHRKYKKARLKAWAKTHS